MGIWDAWAIRWGYRPIIGAETPEDELETLNEWIVVVGAGLVLQGMGQGLCGPSLNAAVASAVPQESLGIATATNRLINQVGTAFGIALLTGIYDSPYGYYAAFFAGGIMALLAVVTASRMKG